MSAILGPCVTDYARCAAREAWWRFTRRDTAVAFSGRKSSLDRARQPSWLADICRDSYYLRASGIAEQNEAHRRFSAGYFTGLSVSEVRCFGPEQRLSLADGDRVAKWTVILGENGVGKTTLLQCAWAMAPYVSEPRPGALWGSHPRGSLVLLQSLALRRAATSNMSIRADIVLNEPLTSAKVGVTASAHIRSESPVHQTSKGYPEWANVVCCGYGALRRSAEAVVEAGDSGRSAASLFSDDAALISGSEWLLRSAARVSGRTPDTPDRDERRQRRYTHAMDLTRTEIDEMLRRADEIRVKLRRATRELVTFGEQLLQTPGPSSHGDRSR